MNLLNRVLLTATLSLLLEIGMAQVIENPITICPFTVSASLTHPTCPGGQDGSIALMVGGSDGTVNYDWIDDSLPTSNIDGVAEELFAGSYAIRISDGSGCADTVTLELVDPEPLAFNLIPVSVSCAGDFSGSIVVQTTGTVGDLSYSLDNSATSQSVPVFENLEAGTYVVYVENQNGCTSQQMTTIIEPDELEVNLFKQDISCPDESDGVIAIQASGGTGFYQHSLDNVNYTENNFFTDLEAGQYLVYTKDQNECLTTKSVLLDAPEETVLNIDLDSISCPGSNDAQMIIIIESGVFAQEEYEFSLDGFSYQSDSLFSNLTPGEYQVRARGPNGCIRVETVSISAPPETEIEVEVDSVSCPGGMDGEMIIIIESGVFFIGDYQYSIDGITFQADSVFTGLSAGAYTVFVMDPNGCIFSMVTHVEEPIAPVITVQVQDASCNGSADGAINITVSSGSSPSDLIFSLDSINFQATTEFENLSSGDYQLYIRNSNACLFIENFSIQQPETLTCLFTFENETCSYNNGWATCEPAGGTGTYDYLWSEGSQTATVNGLSEGDHQLTITDEQGCEIYSNLFIKDEAAPEIKAIIAMPSCIESEDGSIQLDVISHLDNFEYSWSDGSVHKDLFQLADGAYSVTVSDENDCSTIQDFDIQDPEPIQIDGQISYQKNLGTIITQVSGGEAPYQYQWSNGMSIANMTNLEEGDYWVTITDENGCFSNSLFILEVPFDSRKNTIGIYPIPTLGPLFIDLNLPEEQLVNIRLVDARGITLRREAPQRVERDLLQIDLKYLEAALYWLIIELDDQVITRKVIKVTE